MKGNWEFDFSVRAGSPVVTVAPGGSASVPITVGIKGQPQPVQLAVATDWGSAGVAAQVAPGVMASGGAATLHVVVSAATPPGSYMIGVQGTTSGTFKTSEAVVTVVVTSKPEKRAQSDRDDGGHNPDVQQAAAGKKTPAVKPAPGKLGPPPAPRGPGGFIITLVLFTALALGFYYMDQQYGLIDSFLGSPSATAKNAVSTYEGTQTFTIFSAMGGSPNTATGPASVNIDAAGNVLGPVLFGKISNGAFTGEAHTQDGASYPMAGTFSGGVLRAEYRSAAVSWVWNLQQK
ncbi:hypothetical protein [Dehalogenimonas alkenigignens]|uniref:hypothetical protein n=1 Tax=Dehalogenimonas alkenigignens TaxID=1217799 RepID=UPI000D58543F|nr:hypothetical protein [Dehalogenimonas alkenigignens]PVV83710.1 hypothetical protein DD509_05625 [Dehalogenimonas alkenigignens]